MNEDIGLFANVLLNALKALVRLLEARRHVLSRLMVPLAHLGEALALVPERLLG